VELILVERQALDQFLDGTFRLERQQGEAIRNVSPLPWIFSQSESLAEFLDDVLRLLFLPGCGWVVQRMPVLLGTTRYLFDKCKNILHGVLEDSLVNCVCASGEMADDYETVRVMERKPFYKRYVPSGKLL
jgi:hypothetical protein